MQPSYTSLTSSCSETEFPLTPWTLPYSSPGGSTTPTPSPGCKGTKYTIQPGDTCQSISQQQGVGTAWLLYDNDLSAFCADFPTEGEICVQNTCETHILTEEDTWNPILGVNCRHISRSLGSTICISPPGDDNWIRPTIPPVTSTGAGPEPTAAPVPTNVANGTTDRCAQYYEVEPNDYCNRLVLKFTISLDDFLFLNSAVNANCTNLYAFESYCVSPVGAINDYPGHSGYIPPFPTTSGLAYTNLPRATFTVLANISIPTLSPMAPGTRRDCYLYTEGADMQYDIAGTMYSSICQLMAEGWDMSLTDLETLNPSLNTSSTACAPEPQYQYCMQLLEDSLTSPTASPTPSSEPLPIRDGTIADCYSLQDVVSPMTCASILTEYDITMADFYHWNPAVGPECAGLWLDYQYCVSGPSSTSTPSPTPTVLPIRDGAITSCQQYAPIVAPTTCQLFLDEYDISMDEFYAWNPAVGSQCQGLWHDYRYCIRGPATTTSSTTGPTQTPLPIRDGAIAGCQQYAPVVSLITCQSVLTQNGITMAEFYSWNPAVGPECTGLWHDYRYCVRGP
ncbi:hypothetical protein BJX65DRAFT_313042 [Aspergillus insuetus]